MFQKLYLTLDEPDGVAGIIAIQQNPLSLAQQILSFESVGKTRKPLIMKMIIWRYFCTVMALNRPPSASLKEIVSNSNF